MACLMGYHVQIALEALEEHREDMEKYLDNAENLTPRPACSLFDLPHWLHLACTADEDRL